MQYDAKILVIDDQMVMRRLVVDILRLLGFKHVDIAASGMDALQKIEALNGESYDLMLVDWNMPDMDGLEFIEEYKQRYDDKPAFVMLTGKREVSDVHEALSHGIDGYIVKPVSKDGLKDKLQSVFERLLQSKV